MWDSVALIIQASSFIAYNRAGRGGGSVRLHPLITPSSPHSLLFLSLCRLIALPGALATNPQPNACTISISSNSVLASNVAKRGGAVWSYGNLVIGPHGTVRDHLATIDGGAAWIGFGATIQTREASVISGNVAASHGGGFYVEGETNSASSVADIHLNASTLTNNSARGGNAGVIYVNTSAASNHAAPAPLHCVIPRHAARVTPLVSHIASATSPQLAHAVTRPVYDRCTAPIDKS